MDTGERFELTTKSLKKLCKSLRLYTSCPELNEVLHLHQKGIQKIQNLDEYTGLRTVYLECNAVSKMENLEPLVNLRCLYLNQNLVEVVEGLDTLKYLEIIDLADNLITSVRGLACCPELRQLNLSGNKIRTAEDVVHLQDCKALQLLDLSNNKIDEEKALEVIRRMPLHLLRLCGNPIVSIAQHYRKLTIFAMPTLNYLDESPVFERERRLAVAWTQGGAEAEKQTRENYKKEEAEKRENNRKAFLDMVEMGQQQPSVSSEVANTMYEKLEKEARDREGREFGCSSVDEKTVVPFLDPPDGRKRGASQLDGDCKVGGSPQKLLKLSSAPQDEMEVEATVSHATRDFMDLDCGDMPADVQECTIETRDQSEPLTSLAPVVEENLQAQPSVVTSTSEESPGSENPWLRLAPDEMREWLEQERKYKKDLQEKVLQKAAADAQDTLESRKRFLLPSCTGEGNGAPALHSARHVIWGSAIYRGLWAKAATISSDNAELDAGSAHSSVVSTLDDSHGAFMTTSYEEQFGEQASMMDIQTCLFMS